MGLKKLSHSFGVLGSRTTSYIEDHLEQYGALIERHPIKTILFSFFLIGLCSIGYLRFETESAPEKLWSKSDSTFGR